MRSTGTGPQSRSSNPFKTQCGRGRPCVASSCSRASPSLALLAVIVTAPAAGACGSLIADNGAVNLVRTTTLAAYHDGVEHYVTSFEFTGAPKTFGSIIPLPGKPSNVERAGDWTLQRLQREVNPVVLESREFAGAAAARRQGRR